MRITYQGFVLYPGDGIGLAEFANILVANSDGNIEHKFNEHNRLFLFEKDSDPEFYTGLLITAKDQKTFAQLRNNKGKLSITVSELAAGSRLMDFNFLVLNKKTFSGVYQYYHASLSPMQFGYFLRHFFWNPERDAKIADNAKKLIATKGLAPEKAEAEAKKGFRKSVRFDLYFKKDDFETILKEMQEIKQFQFDISTTELKQGKFTPNLELKRRQETVAFANPSLVKNISKAIGKFVKKGGTAKGKVIAIDPHGDQVPIYLAKNVEGFGVFDFDEVAAKIEVEDLAKDFSKSPVIKSLLESARANKALFCE